MSPSSKIRCAAAAVGGLWYCGTHTTGVSDANRTFPPSPGTSPSQVLRVPDGEYLRRFVEDRDEEAFAELVRRNGPLVLRACRSVLRDPAAADDAFQTAFLQLARHAARLTGSPSAAGWLHRTAIRAAGAIRRAEARRDRREQAARPAPDAQPPADLTWLEVREAIDAELARLPEKYRLPLLLCYLEGLTYDDAAARLGCSPRALRGRLERGRQLLRRRLESRGLPAVALALGACACPAVSAGLHQRTMSAVRARAARRTALIDWNALTPARRHVGRRMCGRPRGARGRARGPSATPTDDTRGARHPRFRTRTAQQQHKSARTAARCLRRPAAQRGDRPARDQTVLGVQSGFRALSGREDDRGGRRPQDLALLDAVTGQVLRHQASVGVGGEYTFPGKRDLHDAGDFLEARWHRGRPGRAYPRDKYLWDFTDPKDVPPTFEPHQRRPSADSSRRAPSRVPRYPPDGNWIAVARQPSDPDRRVVQIYPCKTGRRFAI